MPEANQQFIIVAKSPYTPKISENLFSMLNIALLTYKGEKFGVRQSFERYM